MLIHPEIPGSDGCGCCQNSPQREARAENIPAAQSHREMRTPEVRVLRVSMQVSPFSDRAALGRAAHPQPSQGSGNPWDELGRCPVPGRGAH